MASKKVITVIQEVEDILQDENIRWPRTELQRWLNEAYLAILARRPDANTKTSEFSCVAGTRQVITTQFENALRLVDVIRNLTPGSKLKAIRPVDRRMLDDQRPAWHTEDATADIQHFMFDPRLPKEFLLYPPAADGAKIEVAYSMATDGHSLTENQLDPAGNNAEVIQVDDIYAPALVDYMLYRAYIKDTDYAANEARAVGHFNAFKDFLGDKSATDSAVDPKANSRAT